MKNNQKPIKGNSKIRRCLLNMINMIYLSYSLKRDEYLGMHGIDMNINGNHFANFDRVIQKVKLF